MVRPAFCLWEGPSGWKGFPHKPAGLAPVDSEEAKHSRPLQGGRYKLSSLGFRRFTKRCAHSSSTGF
jgi:hypothetical protein